MAQEPRLLKHAAQMRHEATSAEVVLWRHVSRSQLGHKFRRQHVYGNRIFDFFCPAKNLAVEVDGETHNIVADLRGDQVLVQDGIVMVRFTNEDIGRNLAGVLTHLRAVLKATPDRWAAPHPNPSPEGEGL
ncbi:endonuclease domain-containing protein [Sphingobium sp. CR28]|uniref:endonuclease domain-containing protein n=1 Tax=Sphingobium sp. CR28 TaxID=3400272 RepID=UPI003FF1384A